MIMIFPRSLILLFAGLVFVTSCEFEPSGENYHQVNFKEPNISIQLMDSPDTLVFSGTIPVTYSLDTRELKNYEIQFFIDDMQIYSSTRVEPFTLDASDFENGIHRLVMQVNASSGSGSLADIMASERIRIEQEWTLIIDNSPYPPVQKPQLILGKDSLLVKWEIYKRYNFLSYRIYRGMQTSASFVKWKLIREIYDRKTTSINDSGYVGGKAIYRIDIHTYDGLYQGESAEIDSEIPQLIGFSQVGISSVELHWSRSLFPSNFGHYDICWSQPMNNDYCMMTIDNVQDTVCVLNGIQFAGAYAFRVRTYSSEGGDDPYYARSAKMSVWTGSRFYPYDHLEESIDNDAWFLNPGDSLVKINRLSGNEIVSKAVPGSGRILFSASANGQWLYAARNRSQTFCRLDPLKLQVVEEFSLEGVSGRDVVITELDVADDNFLVLGVKSISASNPYDPMGLLVYDMNQTKEVLFIPLRKYVYSAMIADQRDYICDNHAIYSFHTDPADTTPTEPRWQTDDTILGFLDGGESFVTDGLMRTITIRKTSDFSVLTSWNTNGELVNMTLNAQRKRLGGVLINQDIFRIFDLNSGQLLREFPAAESGGAYTLTSNRLFSARGFYMILEN